jgi:hypothetical protein
VSELAHLVLRENIDVTVSLLSALVSMLMVLKTRIAYVIGLSNQGFWYIFMEVTNSPGLIYSITFFTFLNMFGFIRWTLYPPHRGKLCPCEEARNGRD